MLKSRQDAKSLSFGCTSVDERFAQFLCVCLERTSAEIPRLVRKQLTSRAYTLSEKTITLSPLVSW
jgi:hypothetical protein